MAGKLVGGPGDETLQRAEPLPIGRESPHRSLLHSNREQHPTARIETAQRLPLTANMEIVETPLGADDRISTDRTIGLEQRVIRMDEPVATPHDRRAESVQQAVDPVGEMLAVTRDRPVHQRQFALELRRQPPPGREAQRRAGQHPTPVNRTEETEVLLDHATGSIERMQFIGRLNLGSIAQAEGGELGPHQIQRLTSRPRGVRGRGEHLVVTLDQESALQRQLLLPPFVDYQPGTGTQLAGAHTQPGAAWIEVDLVEPGIGGDALGHRQTLQSPLRGDGGRTTAERHPPGGRISGSISYPGAVAGTDTTESAHSYDRTESLESPPAAEVDLERSLLDVLIGIGPVVVALSGGVDSALLAVAAHRADRLRGGSRPTNDASERSVAVTASSASLAGGELDHCRSLSDRFGFAWWPVETDELADPRYVANGHDRCFWCKSALMDQLEPVAEGRVITLGVNLDDLGDHRPGQQAAAERGARFPLVEAGFDKTAIRRLARRWDLPVWDRPAMPCLSSRIPYGTQVSVPLLSRIDRAEAALRDLGFTDVRVRHYDDTARIELPADQLARGAAEAAVIVDRITAVGYRYVTLDLAGLRSGNLNHSVGNGNHSVGNGDRSGNGR